MRIRISHRTTYHYAAPPSSVIQTLRLTPRNHQGQFVVGWRIDLSAGSALHQHNDAFGNITHTFSTNAPLSELSVAVDGEVETQDTSGIVAGAVEKFPPEIYLRDTDLTAPDADIVALARSIKAGAPAGLPVLHTLLRTIHDTMVFDTNPTHAATTAAQAYALKRGVCQDLTHVFITAARQIGIPSRYVSGYFHRADGVTEQEAGHAWAECHVQDLGWVGFDPANGICPTDAHVRVAVGLDYLGAAPVRGSRYGGGAETLDVRVNIDQAQWQSQA